MTSYRFLWFCLLFVTVNSNAQDLYRYYESLWNYKDANISFIEKKVDSIIAIDETEREKLSCIKIAHDFSKKLYKKRLYNKAINYAEYEVALYEKLDLRNDKYTQALYNLGLFYAKIEDFEKSIVCYKQLITIGIDKYTTAKAYCGLGNYYYKKGDFFRSNDYYYKGVTGLEKFDNKKLLIKKYIDYSHVLFDIETKESLDRMLEMLDKANRLFERVPKYSLNDYNTLNNDYVNYYNTKERLDFYKAKYYCNRNLNQALLSNDSTFIYASYTNLGSSYIQTEVEEKKDSAVFFLNKGLKYARSRNDKSIVYHLFSHYYLEKKQYRLAFDNIQKSLIQSTNIDEDIKTLPNLGELKISDNQYYILLALIQKARVLVKLYDNNKDISYAEYALNNIQSADELIDILLNISKEEGSRLYWRKAASEIYLKGILVCEILNKKEKAFYFSEKKKALLLTEDIIKNTQKNQLPKATLEHEIELKKQILETEKSISSQQNKDSIKYFENIRFDLKQKYQKQEDSLQRVFPDYYKERAVTKITDLSNVQETLDSESVVISYVGNKDEYDDYFSVLYAVLISNNNVEIIKIGELEAIEKLIKTYRSQLSKPFETKNDQLEFQEIASKLYTLLIPEHKISMSLNQKHLIIIPDGKLQHVPFESLIKDKEFNRYLIEENEISYAYSMSFLKHNDFITRSSSSQMVAFVPVNFLHSNLDGIPNSINEINAIETNIVSSNYFRKEASKQNFLSKTQDSKIIHLATHANFSDNLQVAFSDTNLEYHELYTSKNNAELVVLSACNTSMGEIAKGEGVMSLARGFFYAGANTVISSLWNANDKSTAQIMKSFYGNLSKGQTKSKALHNAKLKYLSSASLSDASPHYWATFVLVGDSETKLFASNNLLYWITSFLVLILILKILVYFFKKR